VRLATIEAKLGESSTRPGAQAQRGLPPLRQIQPPAEPASHGSGSQLAGQSSATTLSTTDDKTAPKPLTAIQHVWRIQPRQGIRRRKGLPVRRA
jgi:hypothetical protein